MRILNKAEKKVLTILEKDSRLPATKIAKEARISSEGVLKIIKRLSKREILLLSTAKVNHSKLGYNLFPVHIKLNQINKEIIDKIKKRIQKSKSCAWYTFCEGEYDLLLSFKVKTNLDKKDMQDFLLEIAEHVAEKDVAMVTYSFEISKNLIDDNKERKIFITSDLQTQPTEISIQEQNLLEFMRSNARSTILQLAKELNSTVKTIKARLKKLEKNQIITGYKTRLNITNLGLQPYIAFISLGKHKKADLRKFFTYCQMIPEVQYVIREIGKYDMELTFNVKDVNHFYNLIDKIRTEFPFIRKITSLIPRYL